MSAGVGDLHDVVDQELTNGDHVSVLGYSQSATVAGQWMNELIAEHQDDLGNLHVTLLGDPTARSAASWTASNSQMASGNSA